MYKIILSAKDYEPSERDFLKQWINGAEFHKKVRQEYRNGKGNFVYEEMLRKYDSKYDKSISIYRGLSFYKKDKKHLEIFNKYKNNLHKAFNENYAMVLDYAPCSYTLKKRIAEYFAKKDDKNYYSIILEISNREKNEIDACSEELALKAVYASESELIIPIYHRFYKINKISEKYDIMYINVAEMVKKETK